MRYTIFRFRILMMLPALLALSLSPSWAGECQNWQTAHPEWIFCDDYEDGTALVRTGRYFEYDDNNGDFVVTDGAGYNGSYGMRVKWQSGEVEAGSLHLAFGRNPGGGMSNGIRTGEDFREIYYRTYLKLQSGWSGYPFKLSRATVISGSDWSQAMIAHLWTDGSAALAVDPASCVSGGTVQCVGYNDFSHLKWLGLVNGTTPLFDGQSAHNDRWYCIETHVKLNDPGQSNGIQEYWINGNLEAQKTGLDFVGTYTGYGLNAVFLENHWNTGSPKLQERYFDNFVVSTERIGCIRLNPPDNLRIVR